MLRDVLLACLLPTVSLGACRDDSSCLAKDTALLQRTGTISELKKIADVEQADLLSSEASAATRRRRRVRRRRSTTTTAVAADLLQGEYMFCKAKGPKMTVFRGDATFNFTQDEKVSDSTCNSLCKTTANLAEKACEKNGTEKSLAAACGCINVAEGAKTSCEGKAHGDECSFKSGIFRQTIENPESTQIEYKTICQDHEGTLSCLPLRALGCNKHQSGGPGKMPFVVWSKVGSRCINGLSNTYASNGSSRKFHLKRPTLSYCVYKNEADAGKPDAQLKCLTGYNPKVPASVTEKPSA